MNGQLSEQKPLLEIRALSKSFAVREGIFGRKLRLHAVSGVSLDVMRGECLALVGESGCGKSTLGRLVLELLTPSAGSMRFDGQTIGVGNTMTAGRIQAVFQDPFSSMNPRMRIRDIVAEPLRSARLSRSEITQRVRSVIEDVGLHVDQLDRFPHAFSGGQRQRISIARALVRRPDLLICDEAVSALDVSVQAQILNLLQDIRKKYALTLVFISHNLAVVRHIADRVAVMYLGQLVEIAKNEELFARPQHPYTQQLLSALLDPRHRGKHRTTSFAGEIPSPVNLPSGCYFSARCPVAVAKCKVQRPEMTRGRADNAVRCHLATQENHSV